MTLGRRPSRASLVVVAVLFVAALLSAAGFAIYLGATREVPVSGGSITEGLVVDGPLSVLPPFAQAQNSRDVGALLYRGLTRTGPDGRPVPDLASGWDASADAKTFTFHLRPDLHWSDGAPLTAADARFTLAVLQGDALARSPVGQAWSGITAKAADDLTITYTLSSPSAGFPTLAGLGLIPDHALKQRPAQSLAEVVDAPTSGSFYVAHTDRDRLELKRNPRAERRPFLDEIDFRLFNSERDAVAALVDGHIDALAQLTPDDADHVGSSSGRRLLRTGSFSYVQLVFNQKQLFLADVAVRKAIALAIDRQAMIAHTLRGYARPDGSPIPPAISWVADTKSAARLDLTAARKALDDAGWTLPKGAATRQKDGKDLKMKLSAADLEPYSSLSRMIQDDLSRIGIQVDRDLRSQDALLGALQARQFDMALDAVDNGPDPDLFVLWHSSQLNAGGFNFSNMPANAALDKDLETGRTSSDIKTRHDVYMDAQKILREDASAAFLYSPEMVLGLSSRLKGVRLNGGIESGDRFEYVDAWYVNSQRVRK